MDLRAFETSDAAPVRQLIHRTIDVCYTGVYPPRAVAFFKEYHSLDRVRERVEAGEVIVVESRGVIIATGSLVADEISGVFVDPQFQRLGVGARVMDRLEDMARDAGLAATQLSVSLPSRGFYERRGYRVLEDRFIDVGEGERLDYWAAEKSLGDGGS
ncbi:MAG: GNAT family N-acetyltransferase [Coriobacteriia bacterium]|nr:GNAT family N-acetyltransferase [Coriobacteriia bacterium]